MGKRRQVASPRYGRARLALVALFCALVGFSGFADAQDLEPPRRPNRAASPPAAATDAASDDLAAALERRGDLNLHGLSLNAALFTISEQWNVNIVAGDLQGTVNGVFKQAPLREILDSILLSNGYNYRTVGKSLVVSTLTELGPSNPSLQSATISVQTADIDEVVEGARLLITPQGKVQALKSARSIVVLDFPDRVQMVRDFVATLDGVAGDRFSAGSQSGQPLDVGYFQTQHIPAAAAKEALIAVLSKSGRLGVMDKEDRILVSDYPQNLAMIEKVLERIDHPRPQVRITALIYDISLQDIEQLGINWNQTGKARVDANGDPGTSLGIDSIMQVPFQDGAVGTALTFMNLSRHLDITAVALALSQASDARLMGNPNVAVLENEEAIFQSVTEIPYQQLQQTSQGGNIGTTAFKEAGITLRVRPKIAADSTIEMQVMPEFSRLAGFTPGDNQPIIDRRTATTVLRVCDRQTVVIGGLRQRSDVGDFKGVPYLKDMPGLGRLFRSRDTDVRESELVVFIMPEIIGTADRPLPRQQLVADTINCRLDQIPLAEGCLPHCQRLPGDPSFYGPAVEFHGSMVQPSGDLVPQDINLVGGTGKESLSVQVQLRRLPAVRDEPASVAASAEPRPSLFGAPPSIAPAGQTHDARRPATGFVLPR
jgi:general secretion pathway protein D